jgi:hypothetical protein
LDDVLVNLATADCVGLDPAGRLVASTVTVTPASEEGEEDIVTVTNGTIDSPLQNLAIYRQLMLTGSLGVPLPDGIDIMDTAARGFGVASDKGGKVTVDMIVYANQIMGLSDEATDTILDKKCIDIRQEVTGNIQLVEKCFLDYGQIPSGNGPYSFAYDRLENFATYKESLPLPAYVPESDPQNGYFEYLASTGINTFQIVNGAILDAAFCSEPVDGQTGVCGGEIDPGFIGGNIGGFVQMADDTRAVINFMHTWPVPADYATVMPCEVTGEPPAEGDYDLSISEESGLQVPRQVVSTTEGREFIVTVGNAGPDTAVNFFITVTATSASGGPVLVDGEPGPFVFEPAEGQLLLAGTSFTTGPVIFTIGEPHVTDKITWTATVEAEGDVNPANNTVTATSNVRMTGGGGQ